MRHGAGLVIEPRAARDVAVPVQHERRAPADARQELAPARELGRERPAQERREPLDRVLVRQREHVVVKRDHHQVMGRRRLQGRVHGVDVIGLERPVPGDPGPVVLAGRVHADEVEAVSRMGLDPRPRHDAGFEVVAQTIVISGHHRHAPAASSGAKARSNSGQLARAARGA